ncbi:helix-turn-helix domain-containing protein [Geminisphaera colitermitum]|uniref:helix-turn-helix domain-containing protein n=1 Tax=Geminisphaera colitermitum TaxID=1148786 RepID=UPI0001964D2D|nr:helix-turn-helix domain-containing protein [Geminisphaera colitermitum]
MTTQEEIRAFTSAHFTQKETAFVLNVSAKTVRHWRQKGKLSPVRPFAPWYYRINDVRRLAGLEPLEVHA